MLIDIVEDWVGVLEYEFIAELAGTMLFYILVLYLLKLTFGLVTRLF